MIGKRQRNEKIAAIVRSVGEVRREVLNNDKTTVASVVMKRLKVIKAGIAIST